MKICTLSQPNSCSQRPLGITMERMRAVQETMGSSVITNKTTQISNKLLTLASPKPKRPWICRHVKVIVPSIGIIWYLPMSWLVHSFLEMICIREMDLIGPSHLNSVVQVLIALSVAALVIFTLSAVLKVDQSLDDPSCGDSNLKTTSVEHLLQAIRSQIYPLQALAAFMLLNSFLLLQISQAAFDSLVEASENETVTKDKNWLEANSSGTTLPLLPLPAEKQMTYLAFCGYFAIPLIIYAIQESDQLWQKEKLWGFLYSFILMLLPFKYLSLSLTFYVICETAYKSPQSILFQDISKWLPFLYITSTLCLFFFSFALKIFIELSLKPVLITGSTNVTLRRKVYSNPSPLGVILTSVLIFGCEIPFILHFIYFILCGISESSIVCLLLFSTAFCLVIVTVSLVVGFKRNCHTTKFRKKNKREDSGVCLANSFVYQNRPEASKA